MTHALCLLCILIELLTEQSVPEWSYQDFGKDCTVVQYRLGSLLIRKGLIQPEQLDAALVYQRDQGLPLGQALIALGHVSQRQINRALRKQSRIRLCAAVVAFIMAPFNWCHASEDELEHLPEYQYTQVADQFYFDGESEFGGSNQQGTLDLLEVTTSAAWYLYQGDASLEKIDDIPVKLNIATVKGSDFRLQLSIEF